MVQLAHYQQKLKRGYDANVRIRHLTPSDLVLRKVVGTAKKSVLGKIGAELGRTLLYHLQRWH